MRQIVLIGLAAFAAGCLAVQRLPDGSANYGGLVTPEGVTQLQTSATVMTAVSEASRNGQPVSASFDGRGGGSVQVGFAYGFYPNAYGYDPQFAASAMRSQQVWAVQVAAEQPIPIGGGISALDRRVTSLEEVEALEVRERKAKAGRK